ncbi:MAG: hypothetical protein HY662_00660 [Chloroflexi bacterium]|nr:hypothetical protein [Chloroflexota bacterium]
MDTLSKLQLDPLKQLLFIVTDEAFMPKQLAVDIDTLSRVLDDLGERMDTDFRATWQNRLREAIAKCEDASCSITSEVRSTCGAALQALQGRFHETVEKDYACAAIAYEEAASRLGNISDDSWGSLAGNVLARKSPSETAQAALSQDTLPVRKWQLADADLEMALCYYQRLPPAGLWDCAGDAYFRAGNCAPDVHRCYQTGLGIVEAGHRELRLGPGRYMLCHLALPYAHLLTGSQATDELERLYRKVADTVFFDLEKRENEAYQEICGVINYGIDASYDFAEPVWWPHVCVAANDENREWLLKLKTKLAEKALNTLKTEYDKHEDFPVPESYYLVAILSELYRHSNEFEKCATFVKYGGTPFDDAFFGCSYDELHETGWAYSFLQVMENQAYARGMLQRPDYKELTETTKQIRESLQRQELIRIRQDKTAAEANRTRVDADEVQSGLTRDRPWLKHAANPGALVNAECLYELLGKRSWSEVVVGLWNALEAQVEAFLYTEYKAFVAGGSLEAYGEEILKQEKQGSVLYYLNGKIKSPVGYPVWKNFVLSRFPGEKDFLLKEFPESLRQLIQLRSLAAHGEILQRSQASQARDLVLGTAGQKGLLESLVDLRDDRSA